MIPFVLASASPARLTTLQHAGVQPRVEVADVDEPAVLAAALADADGALPAAAQVLALARAKAGDVAARLGEPGTLVLGCDSMLEIAGGVVGKPHTPEVAIARWKQMRGGAGTLHTGHWLISGTRAVGGTSSTVVHFADLSDAEIEAYVATGEPLRVAGAFTVDGLGGPYVTAIEGDYHGVVGLSLPLLRELLGQLGVAFHQLWS